MSGNLKLELAQYREVLGFTKFGSDLDKVTQMLLKRGGLLVDALKQGRYSPITIEKQVMIIYAALNGYLNDINSSVALFESSLFTKFDNSRLFSAAVKLMADKKKFDTYGYMPVSMFLQLLKN